MGNGKAASKRGRGDGTLMERSPGVWRLRTYEGVDPDTGRPRQRSKTVRAKNKTEALKLLREWTTELREPEHDLGTGHTVEHLLAEWLKHLERTGKKPATIDTYRMVITTHLVPNLGQLRMSKVSGKVLDDYYSAKVGQLGPNTIRVHHAILSAAFGQAEKWGWVEHNPAAKATPPKKQRTDREPPTPEQLQAMIEACADNPRLAMAFVLGAITGARRGELCGLQWSDIDWERGTIHIQRQRQPAVGGDRTVTPKTPRRPMGLGPGTMGALRRYRRMVEAQAEFLMTTIPPDGWLLGSDAGREPLKAKTLGSWISEASKKAGVRITPHALRYFTATQMVADGVDPRTAAGRLGHSPEIMLRIYSDFVPHRDQEAATGLEALVLPGGVIEVPQ